MNHKPYSRSRSHSKREDKHYDHNNKHSSKYNKDQLVKSPLKTDRFYKNPHTTGENSVKELGLLWSKHISWKTHFEGYTKQQSVSVEQFASLLKELGELEDLVLGCLQKALRLKTVATLTTNDQEVNNVVIRNAETLRTLIHDDLKYCFGCENKNERICSYTLLLS